MISGHLADRRRDDDLRRHAGLRFDPRRRASTPARFRRCRTASGSRSRRDMRRLARARRARRARSSARCSTRTTRRDAAARRGAMMRARHRRDPPAAAASLSDAAGRPGARLRGRASSIRGMKNVTVNEPFFQGHFPDYPVMPGVLVIEAMAQVAGLLTMLSDVARRDGSQLVLFAGIDEARFKRQVVPGDTLHARGAARARRARHRQVPRRARPSTAQLVCEAQLLAAIRDVPPVPDSRSDARCRRRFIPRRWSTPARARRRRRGRRVLDRRPGRARSAPARAIGPHVVITGRTTIGARNRIFQFASIGDIPQDRKYGGEPTTTTHRRRQRRSANSCRSTRARRRTAA